MNGKNPLEEIQDRARDAQREAQKQLVDAQERIQEAQERASEMARLRAREAQELGRKVAETMPSGLLVRLISSVVGIPILLLLVFAGGPDGFDAWPFTVGVAICAVSGTYEYFRALRLRGFEPIQWPAYIAVVLLQFAAWKVSRGQLIAFLPALLAVLVIGTLIFAVFGKNKEPLANVSVTFFGVVYVGWLMSYLIFLRSLPGTMNVPFFMVDLPTAPHGAWLVCYVCAVTWSADAGAYFVGIRFGKRKLAPALSPNKTVEGAIGGVFVAGLMSVLWGSWIGLPPLHCLLIGPILGVLGEVGDLCESAVKRDLGLKDFGGIMPGHGGVLDRFDSLLFTAPVAYYYLVLILPKLT